MKATPLQRTSPVPVHQPNQIYQPCTGKEHNSTDQAPPCFGPAREAQPPTANTTIVGFNHSLMSLDPLNTEWKPDTLFGEPLLFWDNHALVLFYFNGVDWERFPIQDFEGKGLATAKRNNGKRALNILGRINLAASSQPKRVITPLSSVIDTPIGRKFEDKSLEQINTILRNHISTAKKLTTQIRPELRAVLPFKAGFVQGYGIQSSECHTGIPFVFRSATFWTGLLEPSVRKRIVSGPTTIYPI